MNKGRIILPILLLCLLTNCQHDLFDTKHALSVSADTVIFPMIFSEVPSITMTIKIHNRQASAVTISSIRLQDGTNFRINVDGEGGKSNFENITIEGKDSLYIFIQFFQPQSGRAGIFEKEDYIQIETQHQRLEVVLQALSQDVIILKKQQFGTLNMTHSMPYVLYDTIIVHDLLSISEGTIVFMHSDATLIAYGDVEIHGSTTSKVIFLPDRTDYIFTDVPYRYVAGMWNGIYLVDSLTNNPRTYNMDHVEIISARSGLVVQSNKTTNLSQLQLNNSRIHNCTYYGLYAHNVDMTVYNCLVSNCGVNNVYLDGGEHKLIHTTIAGYYGYPYTNLRLFTNVLRSSSLLIDNKIHNKKATPKTYIYNSIVASGFYPALEFADKKIVASYEGEFKNNYLLCDKFDHPQSQNNVYGSLQDTIFKNVYYFSENRRSYYDFMLNEKTSKAIGIGDATYSLTNTDFAGKTRSTPPDAGCYEHQVSF